jgi:hypothetical protein
MSRIFLRGVAKNAFVIVRETTSCQMICSPDPSVDEKPHCELASKRSPSIPKRTTSILVGTRLQSNISAAPTGELFSIFS